jgi:hypothetical protein
MSLRYEILTEAVLKGLSREFTAFGDPEYRAETAKRLRASFEPGRSDAENREVIRARAVNLASGQGKETDKGAGGTEFYAVNVLSLVKGAVVSASTKWIAVTQDIPLADAELLVVAMEPRGDAEMRALSVNVDFEDIADGADVTFLYRPGDDIAVKGVVSAEALRRMSTAVV